MNPFEIRPIEKDKPGNYVGGCWTCGCKDVVVTVRVVASSKNSITWPSCRKCLFRLNNAAEDAIWDLED